MTGRWAATNTLREEHLCPVDDYGDPLSDCPGCAALALVEAALDAEDDALSAMREEAHSFPGSQWGYDAAGIPHWEPDEPRGCAVCEKLDAAAAALRAVREGA